jgi:UDPglucose--hexose-1-phosphate uridylyltransferase
MPPQQHASHGDRIDDDRLRQFGKFASSTLARLEKPVKHLAYNFAIQSAPFDSSRQDHYHWHMEISPRITPDLRCRAACSFILCPLRLPPPSARGHFESRFSRPGGLGGGGRAKRSPDLRRGKRRPEAVALNRFFGLEKLARLRL